MTVQQRLWILCGGLASGKSTVRRIFQESGFLTVDADAIGHRILLADGTAFSPVVERWPTVVVEGEIDRSELAAIVFNDPVELTALESITHPLIFGEIEARVGPEESPVVVELPVPGWSLGQEWSRMVVDTRDHVKVERAVSRGMSPADAESRLRSQLRRVEWLAIADLVLPNHRGLFELEESARIIVDWLAA